MTEVLKALLANSDAVNQSAWEAHGYTIGYRSLSCRPADLLPEIVLPNWREVDPSTAQAWIEIRGLQVYDEGKYWTTARDHSQLVLRLQQLSQMKLTWGSPEVVFLHCAVVRVQERAWCLPGDSKAGKSTLVHALCRRGALFYSDEYAVFDQHGLVHSYPRALWTRVSRYQREKVLPQHLGWHQSLGPIPVSRVLLCPYRRTACWEPRTLTPEEMVLEVAPLLRVSPQRRETALQFLRRGFAAAECLKGRRPQVEEFIPEIWE